MSTDKIPVGTDATARLEAGQVETTNAVRENTATLGTVATNTGTTADKATTVDAVLRDIVSRQDQAFAVLSAVLMGINGIPTAIAALTAAVQSVPSGVAAALQSTPPPNPPSPNPNPQPPPGPNPSPNPSGGGSSSAPTGTPPAADLAGVTRAIHDGMAVVLARMNGMPVPKTAGEKAASPGKEKPNLFGKVLDVFSVKVLAALGPIALLATTITSTTSGFGVFLSAIKLLAATLAPLLLPFFMVLSAALVAVSDILWEQIAPSLEAFYTAIFSGAINGLAAFADML